MNANESQQTQHSQRYWAEGAKVPGAGWRRREALLGGALLALASAGCGDGVDLLGPVTPNTTRTADQSVFFENFEAAEAAKWDPMEGNWDLREALDGTGAVSRVYGAEPRKFGLTLAGPNGWHNYQLQARVKLTDDRFGPVGLVGHAERSHHYYELVIGRDPRGVKSWFLRNRTRHVWTDLASGPLDYQLDTAYLLRLSFSGPRVRAAISRDLGQTFVDLGTADVGPRGWQHGRIGLVTYGGTADFDDVTVIGDDRLLAAPIGPWTQIVEVRDNTATFPGRPAGGWYVTPIHATLRATDGRVLITGFGRRAEANCNSSTQRETGETFLLDPADIDTLDGGTLFVTPLNEQNVVPSGTDSGADDVLYCAGHNTLSDGRIFFSAGTRYRGGLPDFDDEHGVNYTRLYRPGSNSFVRISAPMKGSDPDAPGMKWYPTNLLLPDSKVLIFGGFHYSSPSDALQAVAPKPNLSLELFDPAVWDANNSADPFTVLTQHANGDGDTPPTRGYTNLFLLPRPVNAASAGNFSRSVAVSGGVGRVVLFTHESGPGSGSARLHRRTNSLSPNPSSNEKGEGSPGLMLSDGTLMYANGGHSAAGSQRVYFYNPYADVWSSAAGTAAGVTLETGISRMYGNTVQLPTGQVLLVNGYNQGEPGNLMDIPGGTGDPRTPQLIDPYASPRTVTSLPVWPENEWRGYHSFALLLKDGRVLIGGGKDGTHATGCEKNELRIFTPPYLVGTTRPTITAPAEGAQMIIGGPPVQVSFTGSLRSSRGVVLLAPGSVTHSFDSGLRYVPLAVSPGAEPNTVEVTPPENPNVAQPGQYLLFVISADGVPSVGRYIDLRPAAPRVYNTSGGVYAEAECSSVRSPLWTLVSDATRSAGQYLQAAGPNHNAATEVDEGKVSWYDLNVPSTASYNVFFLAQGPTTSNDSFWASLDSRPDVQISPTATWAWHRLGTAAVSLTAGRHQLKVKIRETGARVDKIFVTTSATPPTGLGGTAPISCGGPPCTAPPAPGPVNVAPGTCQATISWSNVAGETGYVVQRNGATIASPGVDVTSLLDSPLPAGTYTYQVQAVQQSCASAFAAAAPVTVTCPPPPLGITNLVVNDTSTGNDGIANNTQWSVQPSFAVGTASRPFGDRTYSISATVPAAAQHLLGKPWIRTAADSKTYATASPPVATATLNGSFVFLAVDNRHSTAFLTAAGFTDQGYDLTVMEGTTARGYSIWRRSITSGATFSFPNIAATTAPFYFVIVE